MKNKILGLDLGSASIGWALVSEDSENESEKTTIIDMGSRIIPYDGTEGQDFVKGTGESKNSIRTSYRRARRNYDRYQMRREALVKILSQNNMMPDERLKTLQKLDLWNLRARAAIEQISLPELGRILLLLNQKRGYKSSRADVNIDKKDTEYVATVKSRHDTIKELNYTIGQYFHEKLAQDEFFRIKENVFPREAYIEEFNQICYIQQQFHSMLSNELISKIRDEIIYYQRPLKSQKGLVATCEFEGFTVTKDGKEYFTGPKVAHKSSPLFQVSKIWESINNLRIKTKHGDKIIFSEEERKKIFEHLDNNEKLTFKNLCIILGKKEDELYADRKLYKTGLQGNVTKFIFNKILKDNPIKESLFKMDYKIIEDYDHQTYLICRKTGEIIPNSEHNKQYIDQSIEFEPLYRLWHTIYSISDVEVCTKTLIKNFGLDQESALKLANIDLNKYGYSNKSVKVLRKILPYLTLGYSYSQAMELAGYNHSGSLTKDENLSRYLLDKLKPLPKNSLRQPVVEKILNQMINLVNEIIYRYGKPDEIRVELARELKQSRQERNDTESFINKRKRENDKIIEELEEFGLRATKNNILKARLYKEMEDGEKKLNAICVYCGKNISFAEAIRGDNVDIEHIIPKSKLFDDSQSNKTLAHRKCNSTKGNLTAFDFMKGSKSDQEFNAYVERVNTLFKNHVISKTKRDKLLMPENEIPDNFIERQLRESQYISRKAREILNTICNKVWSTSGTVTAELRHLWGWDEVTMKLQFPKYKQVGLTETVIWESNHGKNIHEKEIIKDWSKRDDHRHHAVDALTIACTKQGFIQRFNSQNSKTNNPIIVEDIKQFNVEYTEKLSNLEKYIISKQPIPVYEVEKAVSKILISYKSGKKVISKGTRKVGQKGNKKVVQRDIIIPRGALSEEIIYGKIRLLEKNKPLKYLFENPDLIVKQYIRDLIMDRIASNNNDVKKAYSQTRKDPIYLDENKTIALEYASCYEEKYVIKYPVNSSFNKVDKVIDNKIRQILTDRLKKYNNNPKEAYKDIITEDKSTIPWFKDEGLSRPIYSVRCLTGLSAVVPARKNNDGNNIGYVKPGNNHHIAIYSDNQGKLVEHTCTFWHAVERRKYGLPSIIKNSDELWDYIQLKITHELPESFLNQLPPPGYELKHSLQQNEMFILGIPKEEVETLLERGDFSTLSNNLYRVQSISSNDYYLRHHLETQIVNTRESMIARRFYRIQSIKAFNEIHPYKIKIDILGKPLI